MTREASEAARARESARRFRYRTTVLVGRWRRSHSDAIEDAVAAKQAFLDEASGVTWIVPGRIEEDEV